MKLAQYSHSLVSIVDIDILGWGLLKLCNWNFFILQKNLLDYLNRIYIWQVLPQLSWGDTC